MNGKPRLVEITDPKQLGVGDLVETSLGKAKIVGWSEDRVAICHLTTYTSISEKTRAWGYRSQI